MTEPINVTYTLTLQDEQRARLLAFGLKRIVVVGLVLLAGNIILYALRGMPPWYATASEPAWQPLLSGIFIGASIGYAVGLPLAIYVRPAIQRRLKPRPHVLSLVLDEDSARIEGDLASSDIKWAGFPKARCDKSYCLLVFAPLQYVTVPLRAFAREAERLRVLERVRSKIPKFQQV